MKLVRLTCREWVIDITFLIRLIDNSHPLRKFLQIWDNLPALGMTQIDITYVYKQGEGPEEYEESAGIC